MCIVHTKLCGNVGQVEEIDNETEFSYTNKGALKQVITFLVEFEKLRRAILASLCLSVCSSVCPHRKTRLQKKGFS
jgi:hypothetical protein